MISIEALQSAVAMLTGNPVAWLVVPPGLIIGLFFGAIPGLSISIAMAVFLPITLYMDFLPAILFLTAIFTGGGFGGAIPAILLNIPGTSSSVATAFDGYPMARQGRHGEALGIGLVSSVLGTLIGYMLLLLSVQTVAHWVLKLGPTEMLVVAIWGIMLIAILNDSTISKGIAAGIFGILISTIGYSDAGLMRGTFGSMYLLDGIPVIPALIGFFAASELFNLVGKQYIVEDRELRVVKFRNIVDGMRQALSKPLELARGSVMGTVIGAIPGVGASIANLAAYAVAKQRSDNPEQFGKGARSGLLAAESANSSSEGGSMITLLALGLPGGAGTAVLLGAFAMHNVTGGPRFIAENTGLVYALILGNMAQALLMLVVGCGFIFLAGYIVKLSLKHMIPLVLVLSVMGAYTITGNMVGPITIVVTGIIGWLMRRYGFPVAATVVGMLVGGIAEGELVRSLQLSGGNIIGFVADRPITLVLLALMLLSILPRLFSYLRKRRQARTKRFNSTQELP